jgi:hypothetical protein
MRRKKKLQTVIHFTLFILLASHNNHAKNVIAIYVFLTKVDSVTEKDVPP